jgi:hypothetical protein
MVFNKGMVKMEEIIKIVVTKFMSGKFILTIIGGITFCMAVKAKMLSPEAVTSILTMIFVSYFQKQKGGGNV